MNQSDYYKAAIRVLDAAKQDIFTGYQIQSRTKLPKDVVIKVLSGMHETGLVRIVEGETLEINQDNMGEIYFHCPLSKNALGLIKTGMDLCKKLYSK